MFCAQDERQCGHGVPERHAAGRETDGGHQLLHTAGRLRARPADRQGVDDGGRAPQAADHRVGDRQGSTGGGPAGRVGPVRARRHGYQTAFRRPKEATVHRSGARGQPVDIIPGRTHHVSCTHTHTRAVPFARRSRPGAIGNRAFYTRTPTTVTADHAIHISDVPHVCNVRREPKRDLGLPRSSLEAHAVMSLAGSREVGSAS